MDNFRIIYRILRYLEKAMDLDEPDLERISAPALKLTEQRWAAIMAMLLHEKYIDGLTVEQSAGGAIAISGNGPRITLRGLEYLESMEISMGKDTFCCGKYSEQVKTVCRSALTALKRGGVLMLGFKRQLSAALLRRDMKRARKSNGLPTDLKKVIAEYRLVCPEYADALEKLIYPPLKIASD